MKKLSHSQQAILEYIKSEIEKKGYPPSVREICEATGLKSTSTVHGHLKRLEQKGFIRRDLTKPRAIELLQNRPGRNTVSLPLVGKVAAGEPITAIENVEENIQIPQQFIGGGEHFMLVVQGDSMINAGIHSGDYIVVKKQETCTNGDIAVALIDDEATVKTFYKERNKIRLQPENDSMEPIIVDDCEILGKVVCLIRTLL